MRKFSFLRKCLFLRNVRSWGMFVSEEDSCLGKCSIRRFGLKLLRDLRSNTGFFDRSGIAMHLDGLAHHPHGRYWQGAIRVCRYGLPKRWATVIGFAQVACFDSWDCRRNQGFCLFSRNGSLCGPLCGSNHLFRVHRSLLQLDIRPQTHYNCAFNVIVRNVTEQSFYFLHRIDMLNGVFLFVLFYACTLCAFLPCSPSPNRWIPSVKCICDREIQKMFWLL